MTADCLVQLAVSSDEKRMWRDVRLSLEPSSNLTSCIRRVPGIRATFPFLHSLASYFILSVLPAKSDSP